MNSKREAREWGRRAGVVLLSMLLCAPLPAQQDEKGRGVRAEGSHAQPAGLSELAVENLDRVAAGAGQIADVLRRDAGLLVELKRWVAKEATDNGQIVEDGDLTDQAIFDRLQRDVPFRAVATRLLQRYGYLTPSVNPDSEFAKDQELLRKERARRLVQIEAREDAEGLSGGKSNEPLERASACDAQRDPDCAESSAPRTPRRRVAPGGEAPRPEGNSPPEFLPPSSSASKILQASGAEPEQRGRLSGQPGLEMASSTVKRAPELAPEMSGLEALAPLGGPTERSERYARESSSANPGAGMERGISSKSARAGVRTEAELQPVAMVRQPNPYADIPSLYDMYVQASVRQRQPERFGLEVFRNGTREADAVPMDLPVGPDYVVGPGDGLAIDLWGGVSQRLVRTVDSEGRLSLPESGPLLVSGRTLGEVQDAVQHALRAQFRDVSADVSLSRLRTVRVYVVGDVAEPGAYDISSLSTPLNALVAAGGVTGRGSLRTLKHYRGKQLVEEVDAYDLLLHGVRGDAKRLENGDTLLVPPLGAQVTVEGMVRRPAVYELRGEKSLAEVLELAGGILPAAALRHIEVQRLDAHEKRSMLSLDISAGSNAEAITGQLSSFAVHDGDEVHIFPIAPYNADTIYLEGHVLRPGRYSYKSGMKLTDLVASYSDLLPEPAAHYAEIVRLNAPDNHPSVESFDLATALANPAAAPKLDPRDTVRIFSRFDFEPAPVVRVGGEVRAPGLYRTSGQAHLRDAIYLAGGVTQDALLDSAQLFRSLPDGTMKILSVNLSEALAGDPLQNIVLQPRDRILVHRNAKRVDPPTVLIKGEVAKPGRYPWAENMRVSDLIRSAGGVKRSAATETVDLTRYPLSESGPAAGEHHAVNLAAALGGDAAQDLPLRDGDVLSVPQIAGWNDVGATITVRGEVRNPGVYGIRPGERLSSVLRRAGGFLPTAYPGAAVFERIEVRELQEKSRQDLIQRLEREAASAKSSFNASASEQAELRQAAYQQRERAVEGVRKAPATGRLVVNISSDLQAFVKSSSDIEVRAGDSVEIPKRPGFVLVVGQVYNSNAITYQPHKNAGWFLQRAGGPTNMADHGAIFIIRANGSVESGHGSLWSGGVLSRPVGPGDTIVVPEKAIGGGVVWKNMLAVAQIAQSGALTALLAMR
ncbi:MAG: SLBB domain-containing protein [Acidobacteriia bacterium]|nr:SLBB domain-containing protein [Terriglobia bacterium]